MKKYALCLGNIAYDLIVKKKTKESSFIFDAQPGGSVFNTSLLLSKLSCPVYTIAKTGNDFLGKELISKMNNQKINTKYIFSSDNIKTSIALANINNKGNSSYIFYRPETDEISLKNEKIPDSLFKNAGVLHTGSAFTYKDITFEDTMFFIEKAKKHNVFVSYDPNWRDKRLTDPKKAIKHIFSILQYVDLLKLSDSDALGITGAKTLSAAVKKLPDNTFVTLGAKGVFHKKDKKNTFLPAFKVNVADTIGAGDAFTAGLLYMFLKEGSDILNNNLKKAMIFASAISALVCTSNGASSGLKNITQVKQFLRTRSLTPEISL